ncbi:hypothetical protein B0H19DRAFT_1374640 [Mycena capillaripes]|nr:hypothetical protein B0H19DRAFT_1374640 [Mycena capillaripes]
MVCLIFQFLPLTLAFMRLVTASPAQITLPVLPIPSSILHSDGTALAVVIGVDAQNRTIYAVEQDEKEKTATIPLTGTLVAGTDHAFYTFAGTTPGASNAFGYDCALDVKDGKALCAMTDSNSQVVTSTAALGTIVLDVVSTASRPSVQAAQPTTPNSSGRVSVSVFALVGVMLAACWWC